LDIRKDLSKIMPTIALAYAGYTGRDCDVTLRLCEEHECQNHALCLVEDQTSVCYCVPDYHGKYCQYQYDECQLGIR